MVLVAGAALAAPALVLEARSEAHLVLLPMSTTTLTYSYRQSIHDVSVTEHLRTDGTAFAIERAVSRDPRALEYFRWPGEARPSGGALEWTAPPNSVARLEIAVVERGEQVIDAGGRSLSLGDTFGLTSVSVTAAWRPLAVWLWSALWR